MSNEPLIVLFQCQYCLASSADQEWVEHDLPANIRLVKTPCSGAINPLFILNALQKGADGVLVSGCMPEKCHYISSNLGARRQLDEFWDFLVYLGWEPQRLRFFWSQIDERGSIQKALSEFSDEIKPLGPNQKFKTLRSEMIR